MKTQTLQFETLEDVKMFWEMIDKGIFDIDTEALALRGVFMEKDIELAKSAFAAIVISSVNESRSSPQQSGKKQV